MPDEAPTPPPQEAPPSELVSPEPSESAPVPEPAPAPVEATPEPEQPTTTETPAPTEVQASVSESVPEQAPAPQSNPQSQQSNSVPTSPALHGDIARARAAMQDRKRKKLDKIMAKLAEKNKITNDEVEKLLRVSDATATRYLQILEKENKIKQTGSTGTGVFYEKI